MERERKLRLERTVDYILRRCGGSADQGSGDRLRLRMVDVGR